MAEDAPAAAEGEGTGTEGEGKPDPEESVESPTTAELQDGAADDSVMGGSENV